MSGIRSHARQPRLDADNISLYRHHRCLQALTARHPASPPRLQRGVAHPPVPRHTDGAHEQDQPANKPTTTSANSMTNKTAVVVTRRDGQQGVAEQRQVRRRVIGAYMLQI
ncbi:hypothetical protein I553_2312 [Mycobacterium xenopi 4042]|uniref:Uncharacterized protein n=1 Tax=Mycobacterium xenopi 4042 TaxID=1299334 RepID=X8ANT2_MYCXE|nr:hypothetical protein I553_2312 [Mycobacterium xenopi 4042]